MALSLLLSFKVMISCLFALLSSSTWAFTPPTNYAARPNPVPTALEMSVIASVSNKARRIRDSILSRERSSDELKIGIAGFYDRSSKLWESVWGEVRRRCTALLTAAIHAYFISQSLFLQSYSICIMDIMSLQIGRIMFKPR
jgi:hypothetical protein